MDFVGDEKDVDVESAALNFAAMALTIWPPWAIRALSAGRLIEGGLATVLVLGELLGDKDFCRRGISVSTIKTRSDSCRGSEKGGFGSTGDPRFLR